MKTIKLLLLLLLMSGCSLTLPVHGEFKDKSESFLGEATGYLDGSGKLTIQSENGTSCAGQFKYSSSRVTGKGEFKCNDEQTGTFFFTSNGTEGKGFGKTNTGKLFQFEFGGQEYTAARAQQWDAMEKSFNNLNKTLNPPVTTCNSYGNNITCQTL